MRELLRDLECELLVRCRFKTQTEARSAVFAFIGGFYNPRRRHSSIGYLPPIDYEHRHHAARPSIATHTSPPPCQSPRLGPCGGLQQRESPRPAQGPLTWATLRVLRALLWRFHGADGGGRCFPRYERIATAAKCHRDTVNVALKALEDAGILTWVHRIARIRSPGARPIRSSGERVAGDPHQQRLPVSRPAGA